MCDCHSADPPCAGCRITILFCPTVLLFCFDLQLCSDKTGTLTLNKMVIQDDCPIYTPGVTKEDVLKSAALAAKWKEPPMDALDTLVLLNSGLDLKELDVYEQVGGSSAHDSRTECSMPSCKHLLQVVV